MLVWDSGSVFLEGEQIVERRHGGEPDLMAKDKHFSYSPDPYNFLQRSFARPRICSIGSSHKTNCFHSKS